MEYVLAGLAAWIVCGLGAWLGAAAIIGDWDWDATAISAAVTCGPLALAVAAAVIIRPRLKAVGEPRN